MPFIFKAWQLPQIKRTTCLECVPSPFPALTWRDPFLTRLLTLPGNKAKVSPQALLAGYSLAIMRPVSTPEETTNFYGRYFAAKAVAK